MKNKSIVFIGLSAVLLVTVPSVFAENTVSISNNGEGSTSNVNVETNTGNNTVCVNGNCTTSGGENGKSTVCINGDCTTSGGDIKVESEDGSAKVNIKNNSSSVKIEQKSDSQTSIRVDQDTKGAKINAESEEEDKKKAEEAKKKAASNAAAAKEKAKKEITDKEFDLKEFVEKSLESLRKIVTFQFLFGDK